MKKEKKSISRKMAEIVSNLENEDGTILFDLDFMKKTLDENTGFDEDGNQKYIDKFAWIIHDKDTKIVKNDETGEEVEISVIPHVHLQLHFPYAVSFNRIARDFRIEENFVSIIKSKNYADALLYLVHGNLSAQDKYQYSWDEVVSNFDVEQEVTKLKNRILIKDIQNQIMNGEIKQYNMYSKIPQSILLDQHIKIEVAFKLRAKKLMSEQHNRSMACIYIYGSSGVGKTSLAKRICENAGLNYYISSAGKNWADDYQSQEAICLEDFRNEDMTFQQLLKATDNHTSSGLSARYYNRVMECSVFIITTVKSIDDLYADPYNESKEDLVQLKRRCTIMIHMTMNEIIVYQWDVIKQGYRHAYTLPNDIRDYVVSIEQKHDDKKDVKQLLSFLATEKPTTLEQSIDGYMAIETSAEQKTLIQEVYEEIKNTPVDIDDIFKSLMPTKESEDT